MPPFSRLQLAAALIEYDNDPDDPYAPYRSAESSAIFSFLRNKPDPRHTIMGYDEMPRKSVDYLQVELPNEETPSALAGLPILQQQQQQQQPRKSVDARKSMDRLADGRKTPDGRRSIEPLARPPSELAQWNGTMFRDAEDEFEDEEEPHDMPEVNLASWGVDQFLTKKEEKPRPRSRASSINAYSRAASPGPSLHTLTRPRGTSVSSAHALGANVVPPERGANRRSGGYRTKSMGDWGRDDEHIEQEAVAVPRTSVSSSGRARPTSVADMDYLITNNHPHPPTSFRPRAGSVSALRQSVPFPQEPDPEPEPNPFEIPLESATQTSRFDPKAIAHQRNVSFASMSTRRAFQNAEGDVPDNVSMMTGPRQEPNNYNNRYSRADILRPKVLVMPSPLQDQAEARPVQPQRNVRPGFQDSTDARPLPLGARSSTYGGLNVGARSSMTLAQLTFRNSLMVGGQRDPAFADFEDNLRRAQYDGERIEQEMDPEPEVEEQLPYRAAGKLYGRSLIDDLEARKAQLKSKQRVFRGDERPSMMQRPQPRRTGTLISEEDLLQNAMGTVSRPGLSRNHSSGEPLVNFGNDPVPGTTLQARPQKGRANTGMTVSRSVFGVDQVWERELVKLEQIKAQEREEEEEMRRIEEEKKAKEEAKAAKKAAKKAKGKNKSINNLDVQVQNQGGLDAQEDGTNISPFIRAPPSPPSLPAVNPFPMPPKQESESDSDSEAEMEDRRAQSRMKRADSRAEWLSDDERQRQAMVRQAAQRQHSGHGQSNFASGLRIGGDDDSDEDVPLTSALIKAKQRQKAEDSEEDKPLAAVLNKSISNFDFGGTVLAGVSRPPPPAHAIRKLMANSDSEDDKPLGLQHSRSPNQRNVAPKGLGAGSDDEDEKPLGMRYSMAPSQMLAQQQQQQQQQMVMQQQMMQQQMLAAQMRSSMFSPMMMGGGGGGMPMGYPSPMGMNVGMPSSMTMNPAMMQMQMQMMAMGQSGSAAGGTDQAKIASVDRWRRDVGGGAE